ncbi:MAG: zinc ribbon domain-containing protein [Ktedonobacteraceae bacterium]|nr:zinc ribbon domain-containing protein [Ktedonobacteraceae bacterium]
MHSRFYQAPGLDIERIARDLMSALQAEGYQVQQFGNKEQMAVQMRKGGDFEAFLGLQAALTVTLQKSPEGVVAVAGQQKWLDKAAVGAIGLFFPPLWPLTLTAGVGVFRQAGIEAEIFQLLDTIVMRQQANVNIGEVPPHMQPPQGFPPQGVPPQGPPPGFRPSWPWQHGPAAGPQAPRCPNCHAVSEPGDRFCSHCGTSLEAQAVRQCPRCQAPLRQNTTFCTRCGTQITPEQSQAGEPRPAAEPAAPSAGAEQHEEQGSEPEQG